jgi:hypothetical protein
MTLNENQCFIGSTPLASYRIVSIEPARSIASYTAGNVRYSILIFINFLFGFRILVREKNAIGKQDEVFI